MKYEKIIKREDGSRLRITVSLFIDYDTYRYTHVVQYCAPNKRKFDTGGKDHLSNPDEILQAKLEFWESIKPS